MNEYSEKLSGEDWRNWLRRRISAWLCVVMVVQMLAPMHYSYGALVIPDQGDPNVLELDTGDPPEAFDYIRAQVGQTVSSSGDGVSFSLYFALNDAWISDRLHAMIDDGTLVSQLDFELSDDPELEALRARYEGGYDGYLRGQNVTVPEFTCTLDPALLDVDAIRDYVKGSADILLTEGEGVGETIGTWTAEETGKGICFTIRMSPIVYNRSDVMVKKGMELKFRESYSPGSSVTVHTGQTGVDLELKIDGDPMIPTGKSSYTLEKEGMIDPDDPAAVIYSVAAVASCSNAGIGTESKIPEEDRVGSLSGADYDEEDEGQEEDSQDMELINDLFTVPMESRIVRKYTSATPGVVFASGSDLVGKRIVDQIPDSLILKKVFGTYDGGNWWELEVPDAYESWEAYLNEEDRGRVFDYVIEQPEDSEKGVAYFELRFETSIAPELWKLYGETGELHRSFPNRAVLKDEDFSALAYSNRVEPEINWNSALLKEGKALDVNGSRFQWTVRYDGVFSDGAHVMVVDYIEDIEHTHHYVTEEENFPITIDGRVMTATASDLTGEQVEQIRGTGTNLFQALTIQDIRSLLGEEQFCDDTVHILTFEENGQTNQIMLIPMDDSAVGKHRIQYYTDIQAAKNGIEYETTIENAVKGVWCWDGGQGGEGSEPFGGLTVYKDYKVKADAVRKTSAGYDETTNSISWEFEINQNGCNLENLWVEDALDVSSQVWTGGICEKKDLILTAYKRNAVDMPQQDEKSRNRVVKYLTREDAKVSDGDWYTVYEHEGKQVFRLHLKDLKADQYYRFWLQTTVTDSSYINQKFTVTNTASYWIQPGGEASAREVSASQEITHSLLQKSVVPFVYKDGTARDYDFESHTVKWKVRLNDHGLPLTNAVLTDALPLGTDLANEGTVVQAVRYSGNGPAGEPGVWDPAAGEITFQDGPVIKLATESNTEELNGQEYSKNTVTFTFQNPNNEGECVINEPYEITILTEVEEPYRRMEFRSNAETKLVNHAKLTGQIQGVELKGIEAQTAAEMPKLMSKKGTYINQIGQDKPYEYWYWDAASGRWMSKNIQAVLFRWTAYINQVDADMTGVNISDQLQECFELIPGSFEIYAVDPDEKGDPAQETLVVSPRKNQTGACADLKIDNTGFSFTYPAEYSHKMLKIVFDTILIDDVNRSQMTNQIQAKKDGWTDVTTPATDGQAKDFRIMDYAKAKGMYFLRIVKTSTELEGMKLKGAEFSIQEMRCNVSGGSAALSDWETVGTERTRKTSAYGSLGFVFLKEGTVYRLMETKAPEGYQQIAKPWYVVLHPAEGQTYPEGIHTLTEYDRNYLELTVGNTPKGPVEAENKVQFVKRGQNGQTLAGVSFKLTKPGRPGFSMATMSNADGVVTFEKLDPLPSDQYYELTEVEAPKGYKAPAGKLRLYVSYHAKTGQYTFAVKDSAGNPIEAEAGYYPISNTPVTQNGSFRKLDQNEDPVKGISFDVSRRGDGGSEDGTVVMAPEGAEYQRYLSCKTVQSGADGAVRLNGFYYGYYRLAEQSDDRVATPADALYLRVGADGMFAVPFTHELYQKPVSERDAAAALLGDSAYSVELTGDKGLNGFPVGNVLKWGSLVLEKTAGLQNPVGEPEAVNGKDGLPVRIPGALFAIYRGKSTAKTDLLMRVKTDEEGKLITLENDPIRYQCFDEKGDPIQKNGKPYGRVLLYGTYTLKEIGIRDSYWSDLLQADAQTSYEFMLGEGSRKVTIANDRTGKYFLNMPVYQKAEFKKVDSVFLNKEWTDAVFQVFADGYPAEPVAEFRWKNGSYRLHTASNALSVNEKNIPYLHAVDTENYGLLIGNYTVKEVQAPGGSDGIYPNLTGGEAEFGLQVRVDGTAFAEKSGSRLHLKDQNGVQLVTNQVKQGSFALNKAILVNGVLNGTIGSLQRLPLAGFIFRLTLVKTAWGEPALTGDNAAYAKGQYYTRTTDSGGNSSFWNIPAGIYRLEELDVPGEYKQGKASNGAWLVERMPTVYVKISPDSSGVVQVDFYSNPECTQKLAPVPAAGSIASESNAYDSSSTTGKAMAVYNQLKVGSLSGVKEAAYGTKHAPLGGAAFTLTHRELGLTFQGKTKADGSLSFDQIPYGTYTLEETKAPDGYQKAAGTTQVVLDAPTGQFNNGNPILNEMISVNVRLRKVDQNGTPISCAEHELSFKVTQEAATIVDGVNPFASSSDSSRPYYVDADGYLNISGLCFGTYLVEEKSSSPFAERLDERSTPVRFRMKVEKDPQHDGKVCVTITDQRNVPAGLLGFFRNLVNAGSDSWYLDDLASGDTAEFWSTNVNEDLMRNILKHGFVQLQKVRGEKADEQTYVPTEQKLEGILFDIYQQGSSSVYLTLKTNADGRLPAPDTDGKYSDAEREGVKKALIAGNYEWKERTGSAGADYRTNDDAVPFTVTGTSSVTVFYSDAQNQMHATTSNAAPDQEGVTRELTVMNVPKRGTLEFEKVDSTVNDHKLTDALFGIYDGNVLVGFAEYNTAAGKYLPVTVERAKALAQESGWTREDTKKGIPYLADQTEGGISSGRLLEGTYTLKELRAPENHSLLTESIGFSVASDQTSRPNYPASAAAGIIENEIQRSGSFSVKKVVEANGYRNADGTIFRFVLRGTPSNADSQWKENSFELKAGGIHTFMAIPTGEYMLFEKNVDAMQAFQGVAGTTEKPVLKIMVRPDGTDEGTDADVELIPQDTTTAAETEGIKTSVDGAAVIIENHWKKGSISGVKYARATDSNGTVKEVPLAGIRFALYASENAANPISDKAEDLAVSGADGRFTFANVPYGTYWVGEYGTEQGTVPEGYVKNTMRQKVTVTEHGQKVNLAEPFVNVRLKGTAVLHKVSASEKDQNQRPIPLSGAEFTVYVNNGTKTAPVAGTIVAYLTESTVTGTYVLSNRNTDETKTVDEQIPSGIGAGLPYLERQGNTCYLAYGEYVAVETTTPNGYCPDVKPGEPGSFQMHVFSIDGENRQEQNQIWYLGNASVNTDSKTVFTNSRNLAELTVEKLVEAPTFDGAPAEYGPGSGFVFEINGRVDAPEVNGAEAGISLVEYLKRSGRSGELTSVTEEGETRETVRIVTGADGKGAFSALPSGTYEVREIVEDADDYKYQPETKEADERTNAARIVTIRYTRNLSTGAMEPQYFWRLKENGTSADGVFSNALKRSAVQGRKVAADNEAVGLNGAVFGLYTEGTCSSETLVMKATSSNIEQTDGVFRFENVPYGTYYVKEIKAPSGYVPSTRIYQVEVRAHGVTCKEGCRMREGAPETGKTEIVFSNGNKRGDVTLTKMTKQSDGSDMLLRNLAEFTIYADEACSPEEAVAYLKDADGDGTYTLASAANLKQAKDGVRYLQEDDGRLLLIQGSYWVKETKIPYGYRAEMQGSEQKIYPFTISSEDDHTDQMLQTQVITNTGDPDHPVFYNERFTTGFTLRKTIEVVNPDDLTREPEAESAEGFVFKINGTTMTEGSTGSLAEAESLRIDGRKAEKAELTEDGGILVKTGADGTVSISGIPVGTYTVTEMDGPEYGLYQKLEPRIITIAPDRRKEKLVTAVDGSEVNLEADGLQFHNVRKRCELIGLKVDERGTALAGAEFGLYSADGTKRYRTVKSDVNGQVRFFGIPAGSYLVKELAAPSVIYRKDEKEYPVVIPETMEAGETVMFSEAPVMNGIKRGTITGEKQTSRGTALAGAVIGLFPAGTTEFTEANLSEGRTAESDADGRYTFTGIPYGTYLVKELKAPAGYRLNSSTCYEVHVTDDGVTVTTGYRMENGKAKEETQTELVIVNQKKSSGGGGGTSTNPTGSTNPADPTNPTEPTNPSESVTAEETSVGHKETQPGQGLPEFVDLPEITPAEDQRPDVAPGTVIEIYDPTTPGAEPLYRGSYSPSENIDLTPGVYELVIIGEDGVPIAHVMITIDDQGVPLVLPKTGENPVPITILWTALITSSIGFVIMLRRKKEEEE